MACNPYSIESLKHFAPQYTPQSSETTQKSHTSSSQRSTFVISSRPQSVISNPTEETSTMSADTLVINGVKYIKAPLPQDQDAEGQHTVLETQKNIINTSSKAHRALILNASPYVDNRPDKRQSSHSTSQTVQNSLESVEAAGMILGNASDRGAAPSAVDQAFGNASLTDSGEELDTKSLKIIDSNFYGPDLVEILIGGDGDADRYFVHRFIAMNLLSHKDFAEQSAGAENGQALIFDVDRMGFQKLIAYYYSQEFSEYYTPSFCAWENADEWLARLYIVAGYFKHENIQDQALKSMFLQYPLQDFINVAEIVYRSDALDKKFRAFFKRNFSSIFLATLKGAFDRKVRMRDPLPSDLATTLVPDLCSFGGELARDITEVLLDDFVDYPGKKRDQKEEELAYQCPGWGDTDDDSDRTPIPAPPEFPTDIPSEGENKETNNLTWYGRPSTFDEPSEQALSRDDTSEIVYIPDLDSDSADTLPQEESSRRPVSLDCFVEKQSNFGSKRDESSWNAGKNWVWGCNADGDNAQKSHDNVDWDATDNGWAESNVPQQKDAGEASNALKRMAEATKTSGKEYGNTSDQWSGHRAVPTFYFPPPLPASVPAFNNQHTYTQGATAVATEDSPYPNVMPYKKGDTFHQVLPENCSIENIPILSGLRNGQRLQFLASSVHMHAPLFATQPPFMTSHAQVHHNSAANTSSGW